MNTHTHTHIYIYSFSFHYYNYAVHISYQVFDNAPGLTTLAMTDREGDSTFYCDVTPNNVPIETPDYHAIVTRQIGLGHDFGGSSSYPLLAVLNVACAR